MKTKYIFIWNSTEVSSQELATIVRTIIGTDKYLLYYDEYDSVSTISHFITGFDENGDLPYADEQRNTKDNKYMKLSKSLVKIANEYKPNYSYNKIANQCKDELMKIYKDEYTIKQDYIFVLVFMRDEMKSRRELRELFHNNNITSIHIMNKGKINIVLRSSGKIADRNYEMITPNLYKLESVVDDNSSFFNYIMTIDINNPRDCTLCMDEFITEYNKDQEVLYND